MATIQRIITQPFSLGLKGKLSWGKASKLEALEHVLVRVLTDEGYQGIAEAPARPTIYGETPESIEAIIHHHLAPKLVGLELYDQAALAKALNSVANNHTARGALDIAICEARAASQGTKLFDAWRGPLEHIRVSFILGISDLTTMLSEARSILGQGVSVFKIKIGRDAQHDEAIVKALQNEFAGEDVILYADANEGLSAATAAQDLERLAKLGLAYVEEPLPVHLIKARVALKREGILPIIADDSCFTLYDLERELDFDTFDILNIKTARTGFTVSEKMLELSCRAGKGVMIGSQASSGLGSLQAAIFASRSGVTHPSELSFPLKLQEDTLEKRLAFEKGFLKMSGLKEHRLAESYRLAKT
jgi:L-alanine-DL-glutamate epimerase-like enolase superfamily enzyme